MITHDMVWKPASHSNLCAASSLTTVLLFPPREKTMPPCLAKLTFEHYAPAGAEVARQDRFRGTILIARRRGGALDATRGRP